MRRERRLSAVASLCSRSDGAFARLVDALFVGRPFARSRQTDFCAVLPASRIRRMLEEQFLVVAVLGCFQERLMRVVDTQGHISRNKKTQAPDVSPMSSE